MSTDELEQMLFEIQDEIEDGWDTQSRNALDPSGAKAPAPSGDADRKAG